MVTFEEVVPRGDRGNILNRIMSHIIETGPPLRHWLYQGMHHGDGQFYVTRKELRRPDGKLVSARRMMYLIHNGDGIPEGKYVKNTCGVYGCIKPEHLTLVDKK